MHDDRSVRRSRKRAKRARLRHAAAEARVVAARARVGPEPSTRPAAEVRPFPHRPFEQMVTEYRGTPESWHDVWNE